MNKVEQYFSLLDKWEKSIDEEEIENLLLKLDKLWYDLSEEEINNVNFALKTLKNKI